MCYPGSERANSTVSRTPSFVWARRHREHVGGLRLKLVDRNDPAVMAVAKLIIELAKEGERNPARLCDQAVKRLSK
jgi:hypothetical protein